MVAGTTAKSNEFRQKEMRGSGKHAPLNLFTSQTALNWSKSSTEIPEKGVVYLQS